MELKLSEDKLSEDEMTRTELIMELNKTERAIVEAKERKGEEEYNLDILRSKLKRLNSRIERFKN